MKIRVVGSERARSRELARYAGKTALDSLALLFDDSAGERHRQFVLGDERLIRIGESSLIETRNMVRLPGSKLNVRGWKGDANVALDAVIAPNAKKLLAACGHAIKAIKAILTPASASHLLLIQRWATAFSVFSEGCRETHDALALAKIGSSLDILSGGGEEAGIRRMLLHLTGAAQTDVIIASPHEMTFKQAVSRIYSYGRSQFLHGNHIDPMLRFASERRYATQLARLALRESILRLMTFTGAYSDQAF